MKKEDIVGFIKTWLEEGNIGDEIILTKVDDGLWVRRFTIDKIETETKQ